MLRASVGVLVVIACVASAEAQAKPKPKPTAAQIIAEVQKTYANVTAMQATFEQTVTNVTFGRSHTVDGKVWLKRPGKMRWDYNGKPRAGKPPKTEKSFVSNGATLYVVELENQQILKTSVKDSVLPVAVTFMSGTPTWAANFKAKLDTSGKYGAAAEHVLLLTPKKASATYKKLYLVVDPATSQVRRVMIIDAAGNSNRFTFDGTNLAATNRDTLFEVDETSAMFANFRIVDAEQTVKP